LLWALAVISEVLLLTRMDSIVERLGDRIVLRTSLLVAAARWVLIGSVASIPWLMLGQVLHSVTYAAFHVAAIRVVYRRFGSAQRTRGQAMYSGLTFGLGLFVGSLAAGWAAELVGIPAVFLGSAGAALLGLFVLR